MFSYTPDSVLAVRPFTHRRQGDTTLVGDPERKVFLAIDNEGFDLLQSLSEGETVGEAARRFEQAHGQPPDIDGFLQAMYEEGLVAPADQSGLAESPGIADGRPEAPRKGRPWRVWTLEWLPERSAARLVSAGVLWVFGLVIAAGVALMILQPQYIPSPFALYYKHDFAAFTWITFLVGTAGIGLHEVGHVVGARAAGAPARIEISHRMYFLVAQTDMTGIWMASRRQRMIAYAFGPMLDAVSGALLFGVIVAGHHGWLSISTAAMSLLDGIFFSYLARLVWQLFFFLRTDCYYLLTASLDCKSLLHDTEDHLRNVLARLLRRPPKIDQSGIGRREMKIIRWYSVPWVVGRAIFLMIFVFAVLPVVGAILGQLVLFVVGGHSRFGTVDFLTGTAMSIPGTAGAVLWLRDLYRRRRARRDAAPIAAAALAA